MEEASATARERKRPREGDTVTYAAAAAAGDPQYRSIADALKEDPGRRADLFAVVVEIGAAFKSTGTDFTVTLRIADQSRTTGISVTFFAENDALLPNVKSSGDVISLHNVVINQYGEDFCVTFTKRFSSFALFESKVSADCSPYQTSVKYDGSKHEKERLTQMRTWLSLGLKDLGLKDLELHLRSLKSDSTFDLVCKVLHVLEHNNNWIFYVWDGTDTPAAEFQAKDCSSDDEAASPPLFEGPLLPREVLCTMPCVGTVLRIFSRSFVKNILHMKKNIYWARFWNITCEQEFGIWKGDFSKSSGVRLLSHEDSSVVERLKMYDSRKANKVHRWPMASFPSNVAGEYNIGGYSTLMESLTHPEVTHKVRTLVRVVAFYPCRASQLRFLRTEHGYAYSIRLTLEDPTTRINAYVPKDDLEKFFGGLLTVEAAIKKMKKLLGVPEDSEEIAPLTRNPPWIWCGLKSYYEDKNDYWGKRSYLVDGTRIRD